MIAVVQRVSEAKVRVAGRLVGRIDQGLLVLLGVLDGDGEEDLHFIAEKLATLRVFDDEEGRMNLDIREVGGGFLIVSQFTLAARVRKGRRPSFDRAAHPSQARVLYEGLIGDLRKRGLGVESGEFGAMMEIALVNDGPVTLIVDSAQGPARSTRRGSPVPN
jgi:D-tyrosyl-tRNA(Tyr) deacylase